MKNLIFLSITAAAFSTAHAQITYSMTIPDSIPEYNGTYESFGSDHFFYPNGGEIRYLTTDPKIAPATSEEEVAYYTRFTYPHEFLLRSNNISFLFAHMDTVDHIDSLHRIDLEMYSSNTSASLARVDTQSTGVLNYFNPPFGATGRTNVQGGAAIAAQGIYRNIDMVYCSNNTGLKIFYIIWPGGSLSDIVLNVNGSASNYISGTDLVIRSNWDGISFAKPKMYQYTLSGNVVTPVNVCNAGWNSLGSNMYGITTSSSWSGSLPLIVELSRGAATTADINNLDWSTYFGSGENDVIYKVKNDNSGNLYIAGQTGSSGLPQGVGTTPIFQPVNQGTDGFIGKFNSAGALLWCTYVGGSNGDYINDLDLNGSYLYCIGYTDSFDSPVTTKTGAYNDGSFSGGAGDGFVMQLSNTGSTCSWYTYLGGNEHDELLACKFDAAGNFFAVGSSNSTNVTNTGPSGAYQQTYNSSQQISPYPSPAVCDAIITKFDAGTCAQSWFTFFGTDVGGTNAYINFDDAFFGLDIAGNNVYACGKAGGTNLPGSLNSKLISSSSDGIIAHFSTGGALNASKYTNGNSRNNAVKFNNGFVYTCGKGKNGMTTVNSGVDYFNSTCASGDVDAVFSIHSQNLTVTEHCTFLGGSGLDEAIDMQFSTNGIYYISGSTKSSDFPVTSIANTYQTGYVNDLDYFLTAFKAGHTAMIWGTCLGSQQDETFNERCASLSLDGGNFLHLGGCTNSYNTFPIDNNGGSAFYQAQNSDNFGHSTDGTITRFDLFGINTVVGIQDFNKTEFVFGLYPNPAENVLKIDHAELLNQRLHYAIYTVSGQKLKEGILDSSVKNSIDVMQLSPGTYIINISNGQKTFSNKFIKTDD